MLPAGYWVFSVCDYESFSQFLHLGVRFRLICVGAHASSDGWPWLYVYLINGGRFPSTVPGPEQRAEVTVENKTDGLHPLKFDILKDAWKIRYLGSRGHRSLGGSPQEPSGTHSSPGLVQTGVQTLCTPERLLILKSPSAFHQPETRLDFLP